MTQKQSIKLSDQQFKTIFNRSSSNDEFIKFKCTSNQHLTMRSTQNYNSNVCSPLRRGCNSSQYEATISTPLTSNLVLRKTKIRLRNFQTQKVPNILGISNILYEPQQKFFPQLISEKFVKSNNYFIEDTSIKHRLLQRKQDNMDSRYKSIMEYNTQIIADKIFKDLFLKQQQPLIKKCKKVQFN